LAHISRDGGDTESEKCNEVANDECPSIRVAVSIVIVKIFAMDDGSKRVIIPAQKRSVRHSDRSSYDRLATMVMVTVGDGYGYGYGEG